MKNTSTLLIIDQKTPDAVISDLAESAFQEQARLSFLMIGPAPALPIYAYGVSPYGGMNIPDNWGDTVGTAQKALADRVTEIEALLARTDVSADIQSVLCSTMDIKNIVARRARVADIAHIAPNLRETPDVMREMAHGVLLKSPIGLMLNASPSQKLDRVFIAWNSSEAASKAVHVALPYLCSAKEVIVGCFDPVTTAQGDGADPGTDVATWLSHHGCSVTVSQFPTGGHEVAQCIQDRAQEQGADLIVMGAYGHARMMEAVFGGTTRTMIEQTDKAVLLAH
ncbi:MAG: nucleotide-binding universal stress UspA family protein [Polaromonas sp.]|jgi:nucleotide-binding universal stress UspA family protein